MTNKQPNLIPAEELSAYERWPLPRMESKAPRVTSAEKQRLERQRLERERADEVIEDVEVEDLPRAAITAEQLQEITEAAEKEGFAEGRKKGLETGQEEGYRAGEKRGLKEMKASLSKQQKRFEQLADTLFDPLAAQDDALEKTLLATVMSLASSIVKRELFADSSHILTLVREAIAALPVGAGHLSITLNPEDLEIVEQYIAEQEHGTKNWQLIGDAKMMPGGCRVESSQSLVNYSVEQRLEQILVDYVDQQLSSGRGIAGSEIDEPESGNFGE